jgi:glycosyltransferase involved in cell wall biosynthesis
MHISFILSSLWLSGGVQVIIEYANRLTARGHQITLVAPGGTLDSDMLKKLVCDVNVRQSQVARGPGLNISQRDANPIQMIRLTWSLAQTVPPSDVVISTHTPTTVAGLLAARLLGRGRLAWLFMDYREMFAGRPYEDWLMRHALRWHERALVLSDSCRQELNTYSPGDVIVVGVGLSDQELFHPLPIKAGQSVDRQRTILFLGDTRPRKGLSDFLQAAFLVYERLKDIRLLIASKEDCQIESGVPFEYIHRPTRAELARLYATCDLFVSASWREGFGLPPLEAMACGAPVVLTDSGGVREYARPGENCLMVPTRDSAAMAGAMYRVLSDPVLARRLAANGPPTAAKFTWDRAVDRFEGAIADLAAPNDG